MSCLFIEINYLITFKILPSPEYVIAIFTRLDRPKLLTKLILYSLLLFSRFPCRKKYLRERLHLLRTFIETFS